MRLQIQEAEMSFLRYISHLAWEKTQDPPQGAGRHSWGKGCLVYPPQSAATMTPVK